MINHVYELVQFKNELMEVTLSLKEEELYHQLKKWGEVFFTTSSELLGEFRNILIQVIRIPELDSGIKIKTEECIRGIDRAFNTSESTN